VAWLVNAVVPEKEKRTLKIVTLELLEIRKLIDKLAERLVNLSDKELLKNFNASQDDFKEKQIDRYKEKLKKQVGIVEKEFRLEKVEL